MDKISKTSLVNETMKILLISRRVNLKQSAPKCNLNLAIALSKIGHKVHLLTSYVGDEELRLLEAHRVVVHSINACCASKYVTPIFYTYFVRKLKKKYGVTLVLGNGYTLYDDVTWVHFPRLSWVKRMQKLHFHASYKLKIESWIEKQIFRTSRILWAPSKLVAGDLINLYGFQRDKIIVLHNGVDINYYKPLRRTEKEEYRRKLGFDDKLILLFVGSDPFIKGLFILLNKMNEIKQSLKGILLLVAGIKPDNELLMYIHKLKIRQNIEFLGFLGSEELKLYYQLSDVFILPSLYDSFSLASLEAMACGSVPVVSKYAGVSEIIRDGINGFIVDPLQIGWFARIIDEFKNMGTARLESIRSQARITAVQHSWINVAKNFMSLIRERNKW